MFSIYFPMQKKICWFGNRIKPRISFSIHSSRNGQWKLRCCVQVWNIKKKVCVISCSIIFLVNDFVKNFIFLGSFELCLREMIMTNRFTYLAYKNAFNKIIETWDSNCKAYLIAVKVVFMRWKLRGLHQYLKLWVIIQRV